MSKAGKILLALKWNNPNLPSIRKSIIQAELKSKEIIRGKRERTSDN